MYEAKRDKSDGVLFLSVGLVSGFIIAAGVFYAISHHSSRSEKPTQVASASPTQPKAETASAAPEPASASPPPVPEPQPPARVESPSIVQSPAPIYYSPTPVALTPAPMQVMPTMVVQQLPPGAVVQPDGSYVTGMSTAVPTEYETSPYADNPNWNISRNGLIGNPPVDPPSSKGRAYGLANQSY